MQTPPVPSLDFGPSSVGNAGAGAVDFFALARTLYDRISGGHDALGFNVRGVPSVTAVGGDGKRRPVLLGYGQGEADDTGREWRPARDLVTVDGDRRLVPRVLTPQAIAAHVRGGYAVAVEAAGWVEWVAIDIDAHAVEADGADGAGLARRRARRVLGQVLGALGCGGERWPVILRSPGGGFHVWIPLARGVGADHRWPASWAAAWFRFTWRRAASSWRRACARSTRRVAGCARRAGAARCCCVSPASWRTSRAIHMRWCRGPAPRRRGRAGRRMATC
jgi:hypothetical protein